MYTSIYDELKTYFITMNVFFMNYHYYDGVKVRAVDDRRARLKVSSWFSVWGFLCWYNYPNLRYVPKFSAIMPEILLFEYVVVMFSMAYISAFLYLNRERAEGFINELNDIDKLYAMLKIAIDREDWRLYLNAIANYVCLSVCFLAIGFYVFLLDADDLNNMSKTKMFLCVSCYTSIAVPSRTTCAILWCRFMSLNRVLESGMSMNSAFCPLCASGYMDGVCLRDLCPTHKIMCVEMIYFHLKSYWRRFFAFYRAAVLLLILASILELGEEIYTILRLLVFDKESVKYIFIALLLGGMVVAGKYTIAIPTQCLADEINRTSFLINRYYKSMYAWNKGTKTVLHFSYAILNDPLDWSLMYFEFSVSRSLMEQNIACHISSMLSTLRMDFLKVH